MSPDELLSVTRARLDEIEALAARVNQPAWAAVTDGTYGPKVRVGRDDDDIWDRECSHAVWTCDDVEDECAEVAQGWIAEARHIALHDPASVLTQVAADRELLAIYEEATAFYAANVQAPAGESHGLWTAVKLRARGLGIDVDGEAAT